MTDRSRKPDGTFESGDVYTDDDFLDSIRALETATTTRIAESVGCERTTAHTRLTALEDRGEVESENLGNVLVWAIGS